jgi:hypothetical protein
MPSDFTRCEIDVGPRRCTNALSLVENPQDLLPEFVELQRVFILS